ncbi:MAG: FAD:protein FMN transferase [Gammaproteobacteria bacterium]|jgi:thiamine biosynthesis lipoprotein
MNQIKRCQPFLGTFVDIYIEAEISDENLIDVSNEAYSIIADIHRKMSFHEASSEVSRLNESAYREPIKVSQDFIQVLNFSIELSILTDGIFDICIANELMKSGLLPNHNNYKHHSNRYENIEIEDDTVFFKKPLSLDVGGVAKGYAVDKAFEHIVNKLDSANVSQISINAGGDIRYFDWENSWVYIPNQNKNLKPYQLLRPGLATSSGYYSPGNNLQVFSPVTGKQVEAKETISVFADKCMHADALTKVVALSGGKYRCVFDKYNALYMKN